MSVGSRIYESYVRKERTATRPRKKNAIMRGLGDDGICPFTLEAIKDCKVRKRTPRTVCLFTLEDCLGSR
jgi:hypothetical protein